MNRVAEFNGGPYRGRKLPESMVPWPLFVPRKEGDTSPPRHLSRGDVVNQSHYALVGLTSEVKTYRWIRVGGSSSEDS